MVVPIVIGVFLDRWLGTVPWLMVVGVLLGLFGGIAHLIAILQRMDRSKADQPPKTPT
jgi:F0F1-type ATP synthase assembly protein I